ncbi:MoxR-like ATPase in aerotolerance operon [hydrothermal vent metagenome]|uniref:MoxR-like ATPase in aerotolerance operon n=1 Tax=hydrothermal vent metagenome TaxID=652676 RepID=A0A3B1ADW1_9ZZZZ
MKKQNDIQLLRQYLSNNIVGQKQLLDSLIISLLTGGHILVEGLPGLAKTTSIKTLADGVHAGFNRIQFTPDLLPSDLTGSEIYNPETRKFDFQKGPLFNEIVLADEINRAPAKVQSALLEAMQEKQITIGNQTHQLPECFMVMATQNPIEQSGTYPLPEAQMDRFLMHVIVDYPNEQEELDILKSEKSKITNQKEQYNPVSIDTILAAKKDLSEIHIEEQLQRYIVSIVISTRNAGKWVKEAKDWIEVGASPRASMAISKAAIAYAYLDNRDYVTPDDILAVAHNCLRHRIILSIQAIMAKVDKNELISNLLKAVPIP